MHKEKVWSRCTPQRQDWDLGTGGFLLQQTSRRSDSKVLLFLLCRDPIPRREVFAEMRSHGKTQIPSLPALPWTGWKVPDIILFPNLPCPECPRGPPPPLCHPATRVATANFSSSSCQSREPELYSQWFFHHFLFTDYPTAFDQDREKKPIIQQST